MSAANLLRSTGNSIHAQTHIYLRHRTLIILHRRIGDDSGLISTAMTALILRECQRPWSVEQRKICFFPSAFSQTVLNWNMADYMCGMLWKWKVADTDLFFRFLRSFVWQRKEWREAEIHFSRLAAVDLTLIYVIFFDYAWKKSR